MSMWTNPETLDVWDNAHKAGCIRGFRAGFEEAVKQFRVAGSQDKIEYKPPYVIVGEKDTYDPNAEHSDVV